MLKLIFLTAIAIQVSVLSANKVKTGSKYKQECVYDHDCGKQMFCSNVCECKNPNARIYIEEYDACTVQANKLCVWHEDHPCVPNASCQSNPGSNSDRSCKCSSGFVPAENGTCVLSPKFGEACSTSKPCEQRQGMSCHEEKQICDCMNYESQFYDEKRGECVTLAGQNCSISNGIKIPCVNHSTCNPVLNSESSSSVVRFNPPVLPVHICTCNFGHTPSPEGKCFPAFGVSCLEDGVCHGNLKCYSQSINIKSCRCEFPLEQVYDSHKKTCKFLVGGSCSEETDNFNSSFSTSCIPNAECLDGVCNCKFGYLVTRNRRCLKGYEQDCTFENCNSERGLTCRNNTCQCFDAALSFNPETGYCVAGEGKPCGKYLMKYSNYGFNSVKELTIHDSEIGNFVGPWSNDLKLTCAPGLMCADKGGYFMCKRENANAE